MFLLQNLACKESIHEYMGPILLTEINHDYDMDKYLQP